MRGAGGLVEKAFGGLVFTNDGAKTTIKGITGDYVRIGDAATTQHTLNSEDDLMITGDLEVHGTFHPNAQTLGGTLTINGQVFDAGSGSVSINTSGDGRGLDITTSNAGDAGVQIQIISTSASPAVDDNVGYFQWVGKDSGDNITYYGDFSCKITNPTHTAEEGRFEWATLLAATRNLAMTLSGAGVLSLDHSILFGQSQESAAVADQVSLGGFEISAGHRALSISSEEVVVTEVDETKFSHKVPIRYNGVTYNLMLCAT